MNSHIVCVDVSANDGDGVSTIGVSFLVLLDGTSMPLPSTDTSESPLVLYNISDGRHVIRIAAVDAAGNVDPSPWSVALFVVTTPPRTAFLPARLPVPLTNQSTVSFGLTVNSSVDDALVVAGFDVTWMASGGVGLSPAVPPPSAVVPVVGGDISSAEVSVSVSNLTSGTYHVTARAIDVVGNEDPVGKSATIVVDLIAPTATCVRRGDPSPWVNTSTLVTFATAADSQSTAWWLVRMDGGLWSMPLSEGDAVVFANVSDGFHDVQCAAVDAAGNFQPPPYDRWSVFVDTHPPTLSLTRVPDMYTRDSSLQLCARISDSSTVDVSVVVDAVGTSTVPIVDDSGCLVATVTDDGNHTAVVLAVDAAGNAAVPLTTWWVLDRSPPLVALSLLMPSCRTGDNVTVCSSATALRALLACQATVAVVQSPCTPQWRLTLRQQTGATASCGTLSAQQQLATGGGGNGSESWAPIIDDWTAFTPTPLPVDGQYELTVRGIDAAGNVGPSQAFVWWLDTAAPEAPTLVSSPGSVVFTAAVTFKLQLLTDDSPGQTAFWYTVEPAIAGAPEGLTQVPQLPVPNTAVVLLVVTTSAKDTPYTLKVWSVDQGGLMSR